MSGKGTYRAHASAPETPMNKFATLITQAFRSPPVRGRDAYDVNKSRKEIVRAHAHGNIRLQLGHWYTRGDVNGWRDSFREYSFTN